VPWGVIFDRYYTVARHPVQLYEAALYFIELFFATWLVKNKANKYREGVIFYLLLGTHFSLRFFAEFFKESQHVDEGWALNMGHLLSAPVVVLCAFLLFGTKRFSILTPLSESEKIRNDEILRLAQERDAAEASATPSKATS
jgi:prolipoprotein diacylglyceryltransferase